jgi:outer membrane protein OmpA-like peptidoglycan-associated protein
VERASPPRQLRAARLKKKDPSRAGDAKAWSAPVRGECAESAGATANESLDRNPFEAGVSPTMNFCNLPFVLAALIAVLLDVTPAAAGPPKNAKDHPMISRYEGSTILAYEQSEYDEFPLLTKKVTASGGIEKNLGATQAVKGKVTRITYQAPPKRTTLEVFRNYEQELERHGFKVRFQCTNTQCGGRKFNHAVASYTYFGEDYKDQRYLAAKLSRSQGDVYVAVYAAMHRSGAKAENNRVRVQLDVIEAKPMDTGMVKIDPKQLARDIDSDGHVAVYAIYFETNSAKLKSESDAALAVIAQMLEQQPELRLLVVGHTDHRGGLKHNMDLSKRRAQAVVKALVDKHDVSTKRLTADGVGYLAPVASNKSEAGRAKNRRVELVED